MVVICVHLLHVNTISISPAFGTRRLHVDPASSLRLQSARGQFCTLANWCQWPTALLAATLAQRLPKATPPEGQSAIMTIPLEVVLTCQKTLARKQTCVTFDGKFMMVDPNGPVGKNAQLWWNMVEHWPSQNVGYLVLWHSLYFPALRLNINRAASKRSLSLPVVLDGAWIARRLTFTMAVLFQTLTLNTKLYSENRWWFVRNAGSALWLKR